MQKIALRKTLLLALLSLSTAPQNSGAEVKPIQIRLTAAAFAYDADAVPNTTYLFSSMRVGFDVIWRGQIAPNFIGVGGTVLGGTGESHARYSNGVGDCNGTFSPMPGGAPGLTMFVPGINDNSTVRLKIQLPHSAANIGTQALMMDSGAPINSLCRAPYFNFLGGGTSRQEKVSYTPKVFVDPSDTQVLSSALLHGKDLYVDYPLGTSMEVPVTFSYSSQVFDDHGSLVNETKLVYFGNLSISPTVTQKNPPASDPFVFYDYNPPSNIQDPPADPPVPPTTPTEDYDVRDILPWFRNIYGKLASAITSAQRSFANTARMEVPRILNERTIERKAKGLDTKTGVAILSASNFKAAPFTGELTAHVILRNPNKTKGFKPKLSSSAFKNVIRGKQKNQIQFIYDKAARSYLKSGLAAKVYIILRFTPTVAKGDSYQTIFSFSLSKRSNR